MFELFVAKRYLTGKHTFSFIKILSIFSVLGITIGVAALVIVLSVFNGFRSLVTNNLLNFDPHIKITLTQNELLKPLESFLSSDADVNFFTQFVEGKVVATNGKNFEIISLKGIQNFEGKKEQIKAHLISRINSTRNIPENGILIGLPLALKLGLRVGDTLSVISAKELEKSALTFNIPKVKHFILEGIFEINNKELAFSLGFTNLTNAQKTLGSQNKIDGLEVFLKDFNSAENFKKKIKGNFPNGIKAFTWYDLHKELYDVMQLERWAAYILLSLIITVAVFNILTSLTLSVLEKRKDIAILRVMGARKNSVLKIFMFEGILSGTIGTIAGMLIGLAVCLGQIKFKFYALDPRKYIIDALPVEVRIEDLLTIALMAMLLSFLASLYPAKKSLNLNLIESIKWE